MHSLKMNNIPTLARTENALFTRNKLVLKKGCLEKEVLITNNHQLPTPLIVTFTVLGILFITTMTTRIWNRIRKRQQNDDKPFERHII